MAYKVRRERTKKKGGRDREGEGERGTKSSQRDKITDDKCVFSFHTEIQYEPKSAEDVTICVFPEYTMVCL